MLLRLSVRNYVLIEHIELELTTGLTVFTGETGTGKSLLVGALALLAGGRAPSHIVRSGTKAAEIEAVFQSTLSVQEWLNENGFTTQEEQELLLKRVIGGESQRSTSWINGRQATLSQLSEVCAILVDLYGQHTHHSLRLPAEHQRWLDSYAGADLKIVQESYQRWRLAADALYQAMVTTEETKQKQVEIVSILEDLQPLNFSKEQWEQKQRQLTQLTHAHDLIEGGARIINYLDNEGGALPILSQVNKELASLRHFDDNLQNMEMTVADASSLLADVVRELSVYVENFELNAEALVQTEAWLSECYRLSRKYGLADATFLGDFRDQKEYELSLLSSIQDIEVLQLEASAAKEALTTACFTLSSLRAQATEVMMKNVNDTLKHLAMPKARFEIQLTLLPEPSMMGSEKVLFQFATRSNEVGHIHKIASGGELSRLSLAIHVVAGRDNNKSTLVFDEVDTGIGGAVAALVGGMLKTLGNSCQILCVTHLPQVASYADSHYCVSSGENGKVEAKLLSEKQRIEELARMQSGTEITEKAYAHAAEMLRQAKEEGH